MSHIKNFKKKNNNINNLHKLTSDRNVHVSCAERKRHSGK